MKMSFMPYSSKITKKQQIAFGGIDRTDGAQDGSVRDALNMSTEDFPAIRSRNGRTVYQNEERKVSFEFSTPDGTIGWEKEDYSGTGEKFTLLFNGNRTSYVMYAAQGAKRIYAAMGKRILVWPNKIIIDVSNPNNVTVNGFHFNKSYSQITIKDGTYKAEAAKANTIVLPSSAGLPSWDFSVGDAIELVGLTTQPENNKTAVIREIDDAAHEIRFYENTFTIPNGAASYTESGGILLWKKAPDLDGILTNDNRAYGYKGDTVYASKLGDPTNWYVYDGLSTSSFFTESGTPGNFTGCISYGGYPVFFKENQIFKLYGTKPSNFQLQASAAQGVKEGEAESLAIVKETLFYVSQNGVMAYTGGLPELVSEKLKGVSFFNTVGGSCKNVYYLFSGSGDHKSLFTFNAQNGQWMREAYPQNFADARAIIYDPVGAGTVISDGEKFIAVRETSYDSVIDESGGHTEAVASNLEFSDFYESSINKKGASRLQLRIEAGVTPATEDGVPATVAVKIQYDNETQWKTVWTIISQNSKEAYWIPILPRRCDRYRIRIEGTGYWKLLAMTRESYIGSEKK